MNGLEPIHSLLATLAVAVSLGAYIFRSGAWKSQVDTRMESLRDTDKDIKEELRKGSDKFNEMYRDIHAIKAVVERLDERSRKNGGNL